MKSFLKYTLATIVGILITGLLFFIIFFSAVGSMVSQKDAPAEIKSESVLRMELDHIIMDRSSKDPFANFDFQSFQPIRTLGLNEILANIEKAARDDDIEGIYLDVSIIPTGMATLEEIRNALIEFRKSGKFIIAYSDNYMQTSYYLASVADRLYMNPAGRVNLAGLSSQLMFFKEGLDKLGVEPQIIRHGKFKSAIEPFTRNSMSEENRRQIEAYVGALWDHMAEGIAGARNMEVSEINRVTEELKLHSPQSAVDHGFVDALKYKDQVLRELRDSTGRDADDDVRFVGLGKYNRVPRIDDVKGLAKDKIAVVYAMGSVIMGEGEEGTIGSERISRAIRKARKDTTIKAIVFRVNSGGGSALASEVIWRELKLAQKEKPVVASLGDVAASGGYYIVAPADTIMASPNTITGSIGVFGLFFNGKELLNDKLGIHVDVVKTHRHADLGSPFRPMTAQEKQVVQKGIEDVYDTFITHVAEGRDMTKKAVNEIAQGRVWSGVDAKRIGLIDKFGGLQEAVELAGRMAEVEEYRVVGLPRLKDPFEQLLKDFTGNVQARIVEETLGHDARYYRYLKETVSMEGIQARIPYRIEVY